VTTEKKPRNRKSRIKLLPKSIKEELDRLIREGRMTQTQILDQVNQLCDAHGEDPISQSGMSRYSKQMDEMGQQIRELREVSAVWVAKLGDAPTSDVGKMLLESVRTLAADVIMEMRTDRGKIEPKALNQLALVMQRVEQAAMTSHKREKEIRTAFADEAAEKAEEAMTNQGMTASTIETIKKEILGIA
jgi:polyhydroxyalkanoate synthesis regulator phasin